MTYVMSWGANWEDLDFLMYFFGDGLVSTGEESVVLPIGVWGQNTRDIDRWRYGLACP